jgi:hypothetical protein
VDVQVGLVVATFACARLWRDGLEVRPPLDAEGERGIHAPTAVREAIKRAVMEAAEADPPAREHLARWRQRRWGPASHPSKADVRSMSGSSPARGANVPSESL